MVPAFLTPSTSAFPFRSEFLTGRPHRPSRLRSFQNPNPRSTCPLLTSKRTITSTAANTSTSAQPPQPSPSSFSSSTPAEPAPASPDERIIDYELGQGEVGVRFINTPFGKDVIAAAKPGDGLLKVGDSVGIHIPRSCQTGLCGSCTCDVLDATADDGRQVIRACQAGVFIPDGGQELVVDVERMKNAKKRKDPLSRFENLDTEYVAGASPKRRGLKMKNVTVTCETCDGTGHITCYNCDGSGLEYVDKDGNIRMDDLPPWMRSKVTAQGDDDENDDRLDVTQYICNTCLGMHMVLCPDCQSRGVVER